MGDSYEDTIAFDAYRNGFYITSWGDWVEQMESIFGYPSGESENE